MRLKFRFLSLYPAYFIILSVSVVIIESSNERGGRGLEWNYRGIQVSRGTLLDWGRKESFGTETRYQVRERDQNNRFVPS